MKFTASKKAAAVLGAGAIAVAASGVAYAYYTTTIDDSSTAGSASVSSSGPSHVTASLGTAASGLVPGGHADLVVTLTNSNSYSVNVSGKTLTLDFANMTGGQTGCNSNTVAGFSALPKTLPAGTIIAGNNGTAPATFTVNMADAGDQTA
jgi:hypothetical protein